MGDTSKFFGRAQDRANVTGGLDSSGNAALRFCVIDMFEVPSEQEFCPLGCCDSDVQRVFGTVGWDGLCGKEPLSKFLRSRCGCHTGNASNCLLPQGGCRRVTLRDFFVNQRRDINLVLGLWLCHHR